MYRQIIKPSLFGFKQETSGRLFNGLVALSSCFPFRPFTRAFHKFNSPELTRELFGLNFPNPVGLAAGIDRNGDYIDAFSNFGFGFLEIGSLSPDPNPGNPKPRIFRLSQDKAIINRTGTPNKGVRYAIERLKNRNPGIIISASIVPDRNSRKDEEMIKDYQTAFSLLFDFVDMFTVNVSSPNQDNVLAFQDSSSIADVLDPLLEMRRCYDTNKPILLKISPDIPLDQIDSILDYCMYSGIDGIVFGNTTRKIEGLATSSRKLELIGQGSLSGAPLYAQTLSMVRHISEYTKGRFPVIACGGIMTPAQAAELLASGASLIQLHTGLFFKGPNLVKKIKQQLVKH